MRARTVDPALLSVVCSELNNRRRAQNPSQDKISFTLLSDSKEEIIREFFNSHVNGLRPGAPPGATFYRGRAHYRERIPQALRHSTTPCGNKV